QRPLQTVAVQKLIEPQLKRSDNNRTPRRSRIGIAPPPLAPTKPPQMLNRAKETRRRNRSETGSLLQTQISNSRKQCGIAKNCAPNCCNNSTSFLPLAILPVVSS